MQGARFQIMILNSLLLITAVTLAAAAVYMRLMPLGKLVPTLSALLLSQAATLAILATFGLWMSSRRHLWHFWCCASSLHSQSSRDHPVSTGRCNKQ